MNDFFLIFSVVNFAKIISYIDHFIADPDPPLDIGQEIT